MRSLIAVTTSVAMLAAQVPALPAYAETTPPAPQAASQNSVFAEAFKGFPNGGDGLSKRLADIILANRKLAPDLVIYMRNAPGLNRAQKLAAEHGLAAAADALGIKAADLGVPAGPVITKDYVPPAPQDDAWFIALSILAVGAITCVAACRHHEDTVIVQAHPQ